MSAENDLALAYNMGYDDALAKRMPDASKAQVLAPYDLAAENAKLRGERDMYRYLVSWMVHSNIPDKLSAENAKLREAVATAIKAQAVLCGDADSTYCRKDCPLHRQESDDCLACDVIGIAQELGIEVDG